MRRGPALALALLLAAAACLAVVIPPVVIIQPFRPQQPDEVALAWRLRESGRIAAPLLAAAVAALAALGWRAWPGRWRRAGAAALTLLCLLAGWFSRQNHFEWIFRGADSPVFAAAAEADFLKDTDAVIGATHGGEAAAYPIAQLAYHHVALDELGGLPVAATY